MFVKLSKKITSESDEYLTGIEFLKENNLDLYLNYNALYQLNLETGKWWKKIPDVRGNVCQEVAINNGEVFYFDSNDYCIKKTAITSTGKNRQVILKLDTIPVIFAVSQRNGLAYRSTKGLFVIDIGNEWEKRFFKIFPNSISWSLDSNFLFIGIDNVIMKLDIKNGSTEKIAEGYWAETLPNNKLGYYDYNRNACFIKNLDTGVEIELFRPVAPLIAMDWVQSGKFVVLCYRIRTGLMSWGPKPIVLNTESLASHPLPPFPIHTTCIFLVE